MELDREQVADWIRLLCPPDTPGLVWVGSASSKFRGHRFRPADLERIVAKVAELDPDPGVYLRMGTIRENTPSGGRGGTTDSVTLFGLWADLDIEGPGHKHDPERHGGRRLPPDPQTALRLIDHLPPPSALVHSGGGLYAFWLPEYPWLLSDYPDLPTLSADWQHSIGRRAQELGWYYGTGVGDVARILRIPGTINRKIPDQPRPCQIIYSGGPRYAAEQLRAAVPFVDSVSETQTGKHPGLTAPASPYTDTGPGPLDDYAAKNNLLNLLRADGWYVHPRPRQGRWDLTRPGKDPREGISANVAEIDGRQVLYVFSESAGLPVRQGLSAGEWYAWRYHGGNLSQAARALREQGYGSRPPGRFVSPWTGPGSLAGMSTPPGVVPGSGEDSRRIRLTPASAFKIKRVQWLWDGRVPLGEITLVAGREGSGKSTFLAWLARAITRGELEGEYHGQPRPVLYAAAEDSWHHTLAPRLLAAGADLDLVYRVDATEGRLTLPVDSEMLFTEAKQLEAAVLMLDPGLSFIDTRIDTFRAQELRPTLEALRRGAEQAGLSIIMLCHFNKTEGTDVLTKIAGSRAFAEVARAALAVAVDREEDEEGETEEVHVVSQVKNNLGRMNLPNLTFEIREHRLRTDDGEAIVGRLAWTGETARTAEQVLNGTGRRKQRGGATGEVLDYVTRRVLEVGRPITTQEVCEGLPQVKPNTARQALRRLTTQGELVQVRHGEYTTPGALVAAATQMQQGDPDHGVTTSRPLSLVTPVTPVTPLSSSSIHCDKSDKSDRVTGDGDVSLAAPSLFSAPEPPDEVWLVPGDRPDYRK